MENSILKIENLSHKYSVQWALRDVSFDITKHGVYGLLGSNGAGKSTLMNIVCGIFKQTSGDVYINGVNIKQDPNIAKRYIGFLPQQAPLLHNLTVEEYLRYTAFMREMAPRDVKKAVDKAIELCSVGNMRRRVIGNLSGGYRQRVGVAQSIIHSPSVVVMDEPTNELDPNQILEVRNLIKSIAEKHTVLLSTHNMAEVQAVCETINMIEKGRLVFAGTVDEYNSYIQPSSIIVQLVSSPSVEELQSKIVGLYKAEKINNHKYKLQFPDAQQAIEQVIELAVAHNWELTEVYQERSSFDDIFAALSKK